MFNPDKIYRPGLRKGTCQMLKGKICIVFIYLNDSESSWSAYDVASVKPYLIEAQKYLIKQAKQRNLVLSFLNTHFKQNPQGIPLTYHGKIGSLDGSNNHKHSTDIFDQAARALNFSSVAALHRAIQKDSGCQQVAYQILVNKSGRSYALRDAVDDGYEYIEYSVMFRNHPEGSRLQNGASAYAHELLHLFGAEDLYIIPFREQYAKRYYPNEIMYAVFPSIARSKISPITAYSIGWSDDMPPVMTDARWWIEK